MGLRALLLPVTGHHADDVALRIALDIGRVFESHISALCLRPDPVDIARYVADWTTPGMTGELVAAVEDEASAAAQDAGKSFADWQARNGLTPEVHHGVTVTWTERTGASGVILRDAARFADLVIMRGLGASGPVDGDAMLEAVLFDAGRPILLCPPKAPADLFKCALIAWAGGPEEVRAITAALPLLARMKHVAVRTVGGADDMQSDELIAYLGRHGIAAKAGHLDQAGGRTISDTLLEEARQVDASLLVMGGYHRSRTMEAVFGGTTRHIIDHVELPVLLAH